MRLKLKRIPFHPFVLTVTLINVTAGFLLGLIISMMSLLSPDDPNIGSVGFWPVLLFPFFNGILGFLAMMFFVAMYNVFSKKLGGALFEFEEAK